MTYIEGYWSGHAKVWANQELLIGSDVIRAVRGFVGSQTENMKMHKVLDVFSGANPMVYFPDTITPEMLTAVDGSEAMLRLNPAETKIRHVIGSGPLPLTDEQYDLITVFFGWRYFDHLTFPSDTISPECYALLEQLNRLLKQGGKLIITDFTSTFCRATGLLRFKADATLKAMHALRFAYPQIHDVLTVKEEDGHDNYQILGIAAGKSPRLLQF